MPYPIVPYNFCPQCGKPLILKEISKQIYPYCPDCLFVHWGNFSMGVGGVVWHENKVLLVQRANEPGKGNWTIPGGFVDQRESIAEAIVREIREETGIVTDPLSIISLRDRPGEKHDLYVIFLLRYLGGTLKAEQEEVSDIGFFGFEECKALHPLANLSRCAIEASQTQSGGFVPRIGVPLLGEKSALYQPSSRNYTLD